MGDLIFPDFHAKTRQYTKGGGIDDLSADQIRFAHDLAEERRQVWLDTAPCEMPPVQPMYVAPDSDPA